MRTQKLSKQEYLSPDPADDFFAITPSDAKNLTIDNADPGTEVTGRIQARGGSGTVRVTTVAGNVRDITLNDLEVLDCLVEKVHTTGTQIGNFTEGLFLYY